MALPWELVPARALGRDQLDHAMKIIVFGLSVSSAWGNGHATLWRGLIRALGEAGHQVTFFERDVPYYAAHRDALALPGLSLQLYREWPEAARLARAQLREARAALITSYCPDGAAAAELVLASSVPMRVFYD